MEFESKLRDWTAEEGLSFSIRKFSAEFVTSFDPQKNPFWSAFHSALQGACKGTKIVPQLFPAGTDSRFLRRALIPVVGFSPLNLTPVLLHDHDEFIAVDTFLRGIGVYEQLIPALADLPETGSMEGAVYMQPKEKVDELRTEARARVIYECNQASASSSSSSSSSSASSTQTDSPAAGAPIATQTEARSSSAAGTQTNAA